ncbi:MAG: VanW family protein [Deltaproteobacteria bacterium]|nr:VanW family protein [Deltaproteobacteria bacterium]
MKNFFDHKSIIAIILGFGLLLISFLYLNRPFKTSIAVFATDLKGRTPEQRLNILKAATRISGKIIQSGEVFSLNENAGPYEAEQGYVKERSFREKAVIETAGGGVCQLASTLYNVVKIANLQIIERVPHSQKVESVGPGMDATVAYGVSDLKFKNNYVFPIKIVSRQFQDQLFIEILGKENPREFKSL